jgi:hypothetical protein
MVNNNSFFIQKFKNIEILMKMGVLWVIMEVNNVIFDNCYNT